MHDGKEGKLQWGDCGLYSVIYLSFRLCLLLLQNARCCERMAPNADDKIFYPQLHQ